MPSLTRRATFALKPRHPRTALGGYGFHVPNRGNGRRTIFSKERDYAAFVDLPHAAGRRTPVRLFGEEGNE
ncbi:MAG TPA: hypothetical protein VGJ05_05255 [Fimbriiglobus sp.]